MAALNEQQLADFIERRILPHSFKKIDVSPALDGITPVALWSCKSFKMNRGIALVTLGNTNLRAGEVAQSIKKSLGNAIGYIPFFHELGLNIVILGKGVMHGGSDLYRFLDMANTQTIILHSIHLVDTDANELLQDQQLPPTGLHEDLGFPQWTIPIQKMAKLMSVCDKFWKAIGIGPPRRYPRGKARLKHSPETGRAALSVRTWSLIESAPMIDSIESGIDEFLAIRP